MNKTLYNSDSFFKTNTYWHPEHNYYKTDLPVNKKLADYYEQQYLGDFYIKKRRLHQHLISLLQIPPITSLSDYLILKKYLSPKSHILEVGSGTGGMLSLLKKNNHSFLGLEVDKTYSKHLVNTYGKEHILSSVYQEVSVPQPQDCIYMRHVFEHFEDPQAIAEKCWQDLTEGGILYLNVPNAANEHILQESIQNHPHLYHFIQAGITRVLQNAGFTILHANTYSWKSTNRFILFIKRVLGKNNLRKDTPEHSEFIVCVAQKLSLK